MAVSVKDNVMCVELSMDTNDTRTALPPEPWEGLDKESERGKSEACNADWSNAELA